MSAPAADHSTTLFAETRTTSDQLAQGLVNDASGLNPVRPARIIQPSTAADVQAAIAGARADGLGITTSGTRHAQGGQALRNGAVLLDMRSMNKMNYDPKSDTLVVQPGATWDAVQRFLDPKGRAVAVMQSSNVFSVGGTVAVNAHGRDVRFGPIIDSVKGVTVVLTNGQVVHASRTENSELFKRVVGGYGLFGTIVQLELSTVANEVYRRTDAEISTGEFLPWYEQNVLKNPNARLMQARLSIAPHSLFDEVHVVNFNADPSLTDVSAQSLGPLKQDENAFAVFWEKLAFKFAERSALGRELLWQIEKHVEPHIGGHVVSRNQAMSPSVEFLRDDSTSHTQVLQEYFVPRENLPQFIAALKPIVEKHGAPILNATIRDVRPDTTTSLSYASKPSFSLVLYIDEPTSAAGQENINEMAKEAAQMAIKHGGSFYLPYALPFTESQVRTAYPTIANLAASHRQIDPQGVASNSISDLANRVSGNKY